MRSVLETIAIPVRQFFTFRTETAAMKTQFLNFTTSPLTRALRWSDSEIDGIDAAFRDAHVQSAAGAALLKLARLQEVGGLRSLISAAVNDALEDVESVGRLGPAAVTEKLRQFCEHIEEQIVSCREDRTEHDAIAKAARQRHRPLLLAVSQRANSLTGELEQINRAADAEKRAHDLPGGAPSRYRTLKAAGLTDAEIAAIEPTAKSPELVAESRAARVAEINALLPLLKRFSDDPLHDAAPLAGIPEFSELVADRDAHEVTA